MPNSERYRQLGKRLTVLHRRFLPGQLSATGAYSDSQFDRARAYRLLVHAEFESCVEELVMQMANEAYAAWVGPRRASRTALCLLAFCDKNLGKVPDHLPTLGPPEIDSRLKAAKDQFCNYVAGQNNGIRTDNLLRMLLPVGIREADIDSGWLATAHSFGIDRGGTAHGSHHVVNPPDPQTELDTVSQLKAGMRDIDSKILTMRKRL